MNWNWFGTGWDGAVSMMAGDEMIEVQVVGMLEIGLDGYIA